MKDHIKVIRCACPICGMGMDSSLNTEESRPPQPHDPSICVSCAGLAEFDEDMNLRIPSEETLLKWKAEPQTWAQILQVIRLISNLRNES